MAEDVDYTRALHEHPEVFYRYPLKLVHGIPLMVPIAEQWAPIENFQARPDDLLIATYPKAGTTWMQEVVDLIRNSGDVEKARRAPTYVRIPFLEICSPPPLPSGVSQLQNAPSPRVIKTHLPFQLVPKSFWENNCKVIYVARNAKDNVVSYFFFDQMNLTQPDPGSWDEYIKKFMDGKVAWGSWYDHVQRFWDEKQNHRILYVFYEDMKEDLTREVRRLMDFLEVDLPEEVVQKIVHNASFQVMKENPMTNYTSIPKTIFDHSKGSFMRKGEVGDWKNYFTVAQREMFDADYQKKMERTNLRFRFRDEL
ncbi:hypothetical protein JRQ81_005653 [Phrynocephalus forsythii]|uniref:Sulfotransferase n=1 Tax=Phrynocephalus forsythii TaxID=171643 RepID=A0A9Q0XGV2_9SAUR|nr:hypothetical protein JRQ81_005653 [Phrynocephalus forsythii]